MWILKKMSQKQELPHINAVQKKELSEAIKISTSCIKDGINWFVFLKENLLDG